MARYVIRVARRAGIVALFVIAAFLGSRAACSSPTPATCRRSPRSTTTRRARSARLRRATARSSASSRSSAARSSPTTRSRRKLRQAILAAEDAEFEQHFGLSIPRIVVTLDAGHRRAAARRARREHAHPAARAQAVPRRDDEDVGAEDQGSDPRDPDREALHQARDLHALLQPDVLRPRRLRRRGGVAALLRQVREGSDARGGGADRRHPPGQRARRART